MGRPAYSSVEDFLETVFRPARAADPRHRMKMALETENVLVLLVCSLVGAMIGALDIQSRLDRVGGALQRRFGGAAAGSAKRS